MLDGVLSEEEMRQLEHAMERDESLQKRFDELESMRRMLLKHRPKGRLAPDFASTVTRIARDRASTMDAPPSWVISKMEDLSPQSNVNPSWMRRLRPVFYTIALGTAAVLGLLMMTAPKPDPNSLVSQVPPSRNDDTDSSLPAVAEDFTAKDLLAASPKDANSTSVAEDKPPVGKSSDSQIAVAQPSTETTSGKQRDTAKELPGIADAPIVNQTPRIADNKPSESNAEESAAMVRNSNPSIAKDLYFMMVVDLTIDAVAQENNALEAIFEKHSIVYSDDLAITESQLKTLEDTRLVAPRDANLPDKMNVFVLRASTLKLGSAISDMVEQYRDFPDFKLDITTDSASALLVRQLSGIQVAQDDRGLARRIRPPADLGLTSFKASNRSNPLSMGRDLLKDNKKMISDSLKADLQQQSTVLLLVRPAK